MSGNRHVNLAQDFFRMKGIIFLEEFSMKKLHVLFAAVVLMAAVMGCASSPAAPAAPPLDAPEWVDELPPEDAFWGIGIAKLQNESLAQQAANSRARRDVAGQLSVLVQGMLVDYAREAGTVNDSTSIQFIESIGRDLINSNLSGAVPNARKRMPDGTWWIRVALKKADAKKAINDVIDSEAARFADFKAQEALKMLDQKLAEAEIKPTPRSED
jgi:hypothetical protein